MLLLVLFSALLSAAETALVACSKVIVKARSKSKETGYVRLYQLQQDANSFLSFLLCTNTFVNFLLGVVSASTFHDLGDLSIVMSIFIALILILIAELIPKSFALKNPEQVGAVLAALFMPLFKIIRYFTDRLERISFNINRVLISLLQKFFNYRSDIEKQNLAYVGEEIKDFIEMRHNYLKVTNHNPEMIKSILELNSTMVKDVCSPALFMIDFDQTPHDLVKEAMGSRYMRIPVYQGKDKKIIGILHMRKLLASYISKQPLFSHEDIRKVMMEPRFVKQNTPLLVQLNYFKNQHQHCAIVVDVRKKVIGLVTLEDVLEHIVGDIYDETDYSDKKTKNHNYFPK